VIYNSLEEDVQKADISDIMRILQGVVSDSIENVTPGVRDDRTTYNISAIDFDRLRQEFEKSPRKNTAVQSLKDIIQRKLEMMLRQNPMRTDFQRHYEELVADYNNEKDALTIEKTFAALLVLVEELDNEQRRAVREGLTEETQALFDLLMKPNLKKADIKRLKAVAVGLYETLQAQIDEMQDFTATEQTRSDIKVVIRNYLWDDQRGLPESYGQPEVEAKADAVFAHMMMQARTDARFSVGN
jgi:type I restriction enzyme R subunit